MKEYPLVSIIAVNYNGKKYLKDCFGSLYNLNYPPDKLEIILVDNGSSDGSVEFAKENFPRVKIIKNNINNYCQANNLGIKSAKGEYTAILNNDTKVDKNWLLELVKVIEPDKHIGGVGSKILSMDGRIESAGLAELPNFYWSDKACEEKDYSQDDKSKEVNSLCGCAILYRKEALGDVDYFDEDFNMYMEDVDISIRMQRKNWKLFYCPTSSVYHIHHGSAQEDSPLFYTERNRLLLVAKHYPEKLSSALLGRGYFTAYRDIKAQSGLYRILVDLVLKLVKHHEMERVKDVLSELFEELKKVSNYENSILADKLEYLLKTIDSQQELIKGNEKYIHSLNLEINKRVQAIKEKDRYIKNLNSEIQKKDSVLKDIYNSTAFKFLVRPLWNTLWKIKQFMKSNKMPKALISEEIRMHDKFDTGDYTHKVSTHKIGICTIISKNYLAYARVLTESFLQYNKGEVFVLLTDRVDGYFDPKKEKFTLIEIDTIRERIPDFNKFCFQYNTTELNTAVKPFFLEFLFEKYQLQKLIFLDPDILITNNLNALLGLLEEFAIILIPHITRPFSDNNKPTEIHILKSGVYNLGFIALSYTNSTKNLLEWWKERLKRYCTSSVEDGLFVDQKWIDLIPGFFDEVFILRDKSYNIAYWNYHYRKAYMENSKILVDNKPVNFLHFSGFDPKDVDSISKHQDRFSLKDLSMMKAIFKQYKDKLISNGYNEFKDWPCIFNYFDNGVKIPDIARRIYWEMEEEVKEEFGNPFNVTRKNSFFNWLNDSMDTKRPRITRLMYEIYKKRLDVQLIYRDIFNSDREAFVRWSLISSKREYHLDDLFLEGLHSADCKYVWMGMKPKAVYKIRNIFRMCCKRLFKNNLAIISKLRTIEMLLYKKISSFSWRATKDTGVLKNSNDKKGVNVLGYINAEHGVGEGARANIASLKAAGIGVSLINVAPTYVREGDSSFSEFSSDNYFYINLIHINADMFPVLCAQKGGNYFKDKYNIGFWNWELSEFSDEWRKSFDYCNEIWVPSSFSLTSISKKSPVPVIKIPLAVSINKFKDVKRSYFGLKEANFIFLFIFDFLSYFERKNPLAIIEAFRESFLPSEKVKLVIKCCNSSFDSQAMNVMKEAAVGLNIDIIDKYFYRDEINTLIYLCDSYISLHRSEGFGLTMAEAMFLGKPVIATGYSGNTDFMNINNSYLVKYKLTEIERNIGPYKKGNLWAEPDIRHAIELMRYVYENYESAKEIGKRASEYIKTNLNYDVIGREIRNRIGYIYGIF